MPMLNYINGRTKYSSWTVLTCVVMWVIFHNWVTVPCFLWVACLDIWVTFDNVGYIAIFSVGCLGLEVTLGVSSNFPVEN